MRKLSNVLVYPAVAIALFGVAIHIGAIFGGVSWFAFFRAPRAVVESARAGTWPAPVGAVVIAILMGLCAVYAASSVQLIRRLPALRSVLAAAALLWLSRGLLVLPLAARHPELIDTFQITTALLSLVAGIGFAAGFRIAEPRPNNSSQPMPLTRNG
jgi:hypothetical protein